MAKVLRYEEDVAFRSARDTLSDIVEQLQFCTSTEYASQLLVTRHGVPAAAAKTRGTRLAAHVTTALSFVHQALNSHPDVASVPAYYAALNLAKCYILASPHHTALDQKLSHGISYETYRKDSRHLLTEEIDVWKKGVFATFYQVITGQPLTHQRIQVRDFIPYIMDIESEWEIASGREGRTERVDFQVIKTRSGGRVPYAEIVHAKRKLSVRSIALLKGFQRIGKIGNQFRGSPDTSGDSDDKVVRKQIRSFMLYDAHLGYAQTPISGTRILLPQEIPIILAFYHLSSVSRYNPELVAKIKSSRFWPLVVTGRYHALQKFCILAWSYLQQRNVMVNADTWIGT